MQQGMLGTAAIEHRQGWRERLLWGALPPEGPAAHTDVRYSTLISRNALGAIRNLVDGKFAIA